MAERLGDAPRRIAARTPGWLSRVVGRLGVRLLLVNLVVLLVPIVGVEFARIHERQLLEALERDMKNQGSLVRSMVEARLARGVPMTDPELEEVLMRAAKSTRTRVRLLDDHGAVLADSHANGPPEGPELPPPRILPSPHARAVGSSWSELSPDPSDPNAWPDVADRGEVRAALEGAPASRTRLRARDPGVFLFVTEPVLAPADRRVVGVVYTVRSTRPVMVELYRIRSSLVRVLVVASCGTALVTLLLAWSISRPLARLSRAAKRVARGERAVEIPVGGGGEIAELGASFAAMSEQLEARLRYVEGFAADVAHEFKSPLTSIRGAAELLQEGAMDEPEARARFLHNIELDVARLDRLVSRLLELSRVEASQEEMDRVDVADLVASVVQRTSSPSRPVVARIESTATIAAREGDLETALVNLVENAQRFSPEGVPVEVEARRGPTSIAIVVRDRGAGISPAHLPKIFERFFTTDAERNGTGLGLAIVETVLRAHGGSVDVASTLGEGSTFVVTLPLRAT